MWHWMDKKKKKLWIKIIVLAGLVFVFFGTAPYFLRRTLVNSIQENCPECSLEISSSTFNPLTGVFSLGEISFRYIQKASIELSAKIQNAEGELSCLDLLRGNISLSSVVIEKPEVVLVDIGGTTEEAGADSVSASTDKSQEKLESKEGLRFSVSYMQIKQGAFSYVNKDKGIESRLNMGPISGSMEGLGNTKEFKENTAFSRLVGRIENSGEVVLAVHSKVFERPLQVSVDVQAKEQNLSDLNNFFNKFAGLSLEGALIEGTSQVRLVDKSIKASVFARFEKFNVEFSKTRERNAVSSFFMNLAEAVIYDNQNLDKNKAAQIKHVEINRKNDESLVGFILRSMKEAALKVAKKQS